MIKMIFTGKKGPDKSMQEFRTYYLERHAPLFLETVPKVRNYTINFPIERPGKENPFDFVTEIWWDATAQGKKCTIIAIAWRRCISGR